MKVNFFLRILGILIFSATTFACNAFAADPLKAMPQDTTLWQFIQAGGWTMLVLGLLSLIAGAIIIYDFMTLKMEKVVPADFCEKLVSKLEAQDNHGARLMCEKGNNVIAAIALVGLDRRTQGRTATREAMENKAHKEIGKLWQNIAYLGDIATIAPLLGLLGTVLGMIQAFNVISIAGASLKPIMLVGGISKSLVTTASGLIIAIPSMSCYSYFRGKVQAISDQVEFYSTDIMRLIEDPARSKKTEV